MYLKKLLLLCYVLISLQVGTYAQSSQGTDFWVAFLQNCDISSTSYDYYTLELTITSNEESNVVIENEKVSFKKEFSLKANSKETVEIPFDDFNLNEYGKVLDTKSLHVTSTSPISVYVTNAQYHSMESALALPTTACGSYYVTQMNDVRVEKGAYKYFPAVFCVIGTEDNTEVEITPTLNTGAGFPANQPFKIKLNAGDVYVVETTSADQGKDFSGSQIRVSDNKKVAVFVGNVSSCIPEPTPMGDGDNLMDVAYPVTSWGKSFLIVPLKQGRNDLIKITAADNGADIYKDGTLIANLKPFETYSFMQKESDGAFTITSSEPVEVYQYMTSVNYDGRRNIGGPSYQYIAPLEQAIEEITFTAFKNFEVTSQLINIIIKAEDEDFVELDGATNFTTFSSISSASDYKFAIVNVTDGSHTLKAPHGVIANLYGLGESISYAYSAGSKIGNINPIEPSTFDCTTGTILFREDFGGNFETSPVYQTEDLTWGITSLYHRPNFPLSTGEGVYDIRKNGFPRTDGHGGPYYGWYINFDDHTSPEDPKRGYIMQVDMSYDPATFYKVKMEGLCPNSKLYLSMWGHPVNTNSDAEIKLIVEDLEGNVLSSEDVSIIASINEWQQVGTYFTLPEGQTSAVYKIYSEGGLGGNDFALDDIEVRLCKPGVEVNYPTDTLCIGSEFTINAEFKNEDNTFVEPVNFTWFMNKKGGYESDGWTKVGTGKSLELKDLQIQDAGYYKVVVSSAGEEGEMSKCNSASDAVHIIVANCIPVSDEIDCEDVEVVFKDTINEGESYEFYDNYLTETGKYSVVFTKECCNEAGDCVTADSTVTLYLTVKEVIVPENPVVGPEKPVVEQEEIEIPTAFTPHYEDGLNDHFMRGYEVYIYDRYGNLVCHSENGWDGTYRGKTATPGVYVYTLFMKNGEQKKGTIEVVKTKK